MSEAEYRTGDFLPAPIFTKFGPMPRQRHERKVAGLTPSRLAVSLSLSRGDAVATVLDTVSGIVFNCEPVVPRVTGCTQYNGRPDELAEAVTD
jgi:hypothetical protein